MPAETRAERYSRIVHPDGTALTIEDLRGQQGDKGDPGPKGDGVTTFFPDNVLRDDALPPTVGRYVEAWGADPTGVRDSTLALRAAVASGLPILGRGPDAVYKICGEIVPAPGQTLDLQGATLRRAAQVSSTFTQNIVGGTTMSVTVADGSKFTVGMDVTVVKDAATWDTSNRRVSKVVGNVVTVTTAFGVAMTGGTLYSSHYMIRTTGWNTVRGARIDGNRGAVAFARWQNTAEIEGNGDRVLIDGVHMSETPGEGIVLFGFGSTIRDSSIKNAGGNGAHFGTSTHIRVDGYRVENVNLAPIVGHSDGGIIWSNDIRDATITNCYVDGATCGIGSVDSVDNSHVTITNNTIRNCVTAFEGTFPSGSAATHVVFSNNRVYDCGGFEINQVSSGSSAFPSRFVVTNNLFVRTPVHLVRANHVLFADNVCDSPTDTVNSLVSVTDCQFLTLDANDFIGGQFAVYIDGALVSKVTVSGGSAVGQVSGVVRQEVAGTSVSVLGMAIVSDAAASSSYNAILVRAKGIAKGNVIDLAGGRAGIYALDRAIVRGNTVRGTATYSIRTDGGSAGAIIKENEVFADVSNAGGASNTVANNDLIAA